jgi:hypothetical protein
MMKMHSTLGWVIAGVLSVTLGAIANAAEPKSPDLVRNALRILAYVQDDMVRKLPNRNYDRLPHENQEFQEAAGAMRDAVATEEPPFKAKVESAMQLALNAGNSVAEVSKSGDDAKIRSAVSAVDAALQKLNALFPEPLRPVPGQLGSGPPRATGPPPGLR